MRLALALLLSLALLATSALAQEPKTCPGTDGPTRGSGHVAGFEAGFPPDGWTQTITNPSSTWEQSASDVYEGSYCAYIQSQAGVPQDEWLSFHYVPRENDVLTFATMGSLDWCQNANLEVWIDGAVAWDFCNDFPGASWTYEVIELDLSPYVGMSIDIEFRYVGDDGADHYLDMIDVLSYDHSVQNLEVVWVGRGEFTLHADLGVGSHGSHDPVATSYSFEIDGVPVERPVWELSVMFCGDCYFQMYPDCWDGWCPDLDYGAYDPDCTDEYVGFGYYRCYCLWSKPADTPIFTYVGQLQASVSIAIDTEIIESSYDNNTMTVDIVPPTAVYNEGTWTTIKGLYR
jgi:hypothetical protein